MLDTHSYFWIPVMVIIGVLLITLLGANLVRVFKRISYKNSQKRMQWLFHGCFDGKDDKRCLEELGKLHKDIFKVMLDEIDFYNDYDKKLIEKERDRRNPSTVVEEAGLIADELFAENEACGQIHILPQANQCMSSAYPVHFVDSCVRMDVNTSYAQTPMFIVKHNDWKADE